SLDEMICQEKLAELMTSTSAETRYGAFRALRLVNEREPVLKGELLNESFWLHRVVPESSPMVHISSSHRAEVVIFGKDPTVVPQIYSGGSLQRSQAETHQDTPGQVRE